MMTRFPFASAFAALTLLAQIASAQPAQVEVTVNFKPAPPRTAGYEVWADGERVHASVSNDTVTIPLSNCNPNIRLQIRPADSRYSWPEPYCQTPLVAEVKFVRHATLLWSETSGVALVDYAEDVAAALDAIADLAASGDERSLALRAALESEDPGVLAQLAREAAEASAPDLSVAYKTIALDAAFRAAGAEPSTGLLRHADDLAAPVLTQEGDALLANIAPDWLPPLPVEGASRRTADFVLGTGNYSRFVNVAELTGLDIYDDHGAAVAQITGFSRGEDGSVIVDVGGFLGIGGREVAVSPESLDLANEGFTLLGTSVAELEALAEANEVTHTGQGLLPDDAEVEFRFDG